MRHAIGLLFALCLAALPMRAEAARIEHFLGTLTVEMFPIPALVVTGEGFATLDEGLAPHVSLSVPAATLAGSANRILLTPSSGTVSAMYGPASTFNPVGEVRLSIENGPGALIDGSGPMGLRGVYRACLFGTCATPYALVDVPLTMMGSTGVGLGGTFFGARLAGFFDLTVVGAPWTTGAVTVTTINHATIMRSGSVLAPNGGTGFASAARHGGVIEMVSPFAIYLGDRGVVTHRFGGLATFQAVFAPEPGTLVLLGAGVAALAVAGRSRQ